MAEGEAAVASTPTATLLAAADTAPKTKHVLQNKARVRRKNVASGSCLVSELGKKRNNNLRLAHRGRIQAQRDIIYQ